MDEFNLCALYIQHPSMTNKRTHVHFLANVFCCQRAPSGCELSYYSVADRRKPDLPISVHGGVPAGPLFIFVSRILRKLCEPGRPSFFHFRLRPDAAAERSPPIIPNTSTSSARLLLGTPSSVPATAGKRRRLYRVQPPPTFPFQSDSNIIFNLTV
ncbi:MAG: hypothetical protein K0Q94_2724 [Paenibacillus sp.]|nr:hypothetical protein [Paenibacillus sp.]